MYLIINEADESLFVESNGNKYLNFADTDKNKEVLEKYTKFWDEIKYYIKTINSGKPGGYEKDYMKIKLNSDDNLPLNKILNLHDLTRVVRSVFQKDGKYCPQVFLDECLYKL